ncbi:ABC transporter substrate-binding protein [Bacillus sp. SD088]|uniref:ABC transporter substrate-binding protein n=1 Tax=Bacillus sp. SD088 TaxID=2782012 RepID=UPI001A95A2CD|nr:sugar ABC transporter substrate-binding protein [Bacillus sp. SD088]MBO0993270.1 sugar ABC transporter substrate-binding protein [Bacillus sp. SD088]
MMKRTIAFLLSLLLVIPIAACGNDVNGNSKDEKSDEEGTNEQKLEITYWSGDRHDAEYIKGLIEQFNQTNEDNIEVTQKIMSEDYVQSIDLAFSSNQAPDILNPKFDFINMAKKGYFEPLDDYMSDEMKERFKDTLRENANVYNGNIVTLPNYGTTIRLVYNQELFNQAGIDNPPETLSEMVEAAKRITEVGKKDGIYGFALNFKNPISAMERSVRNILQRSGYGVDGFNFKTGEYEFAGYKEVITAFKQMYDDGSMLPGVESLDIDPLRAQFAEGKIGMYLSYSAEMGVYENQFPTDIDWKAAPVPTINGEVKGKNGMNGGQWLAISSQSDQEKKDAAWKFLNYMYSEENLIKYAETGLGLPVLQAVVDKMEEPDVYNYESFAPTTDDAIWPIKPNVDGSLEGRKYADAFWEYILEGGNLDDIIHDLSKSYNDALKKEIENGNINFSPDPNFDPLNIK